MVSPEAEVNGQDAMVQTPLVLSASAANRAQVGAWQGQIPALQNLSQQMLKKGSSGNWVLQQRGKGSLNRPRIAIILTSRLWQQFLVRERTRLFKPIRQMGCLWAIELGFHKAVQQNWEAPVASSCPVETIFLKLQRISKGLQGWS
ncbi:hypothetical protein E2562_038718 [Oryza meyeriana var. granulata]|uniref:Uncharacterized protein n=1 Tax=Oryza meyeriana var. granulata TaxID=110450 RepID=A0A6G1C2C8_9ORYZ|nr:hypothetical protein E2562_038718 [Oryza meyeriana var. granulata]